MMYSNQEGKDVTSHIESGRTKKFEIGEKKEAEEYAARKRSYIYTLYLETRRVSKYICGYAVPN